jgi:hypothetical protein
LNAIRNELGISSRSSLSFYPLPSSPRHLHSMSSPVTTDESTYPTGRTAPYDIYTSNVQPTSSNSPYRLELGPPQRRRVNPESLAARLGPELVAEMEKHIVPGSIEMPPFSVRRDIQIKFGIDRRHIYDFFHSRGLRCLNEKATRNSYPEVSQFTPIVGTSEFSWNTDKISKARPKYSPSIGLSGAQEA